MVDGKVVDLPKTRQCRAPKWIGWLKPRAIIRSIWTVVVALKEKPDIVMAYSVFPPGLWGLAAARLVGAAAILQLPGGPLEIESGGWVNDDIVVPQFLIRLLVPLCHTLCRHFDTIIVRGRKAETFLRTISSGRVEIIPGSVDSERYLLNDRPRTIDIVFIGRIVAIKQPGHVCEVIRRVAAARPSLRVVVAGSGPLLDEMKQQAAQMGLDSVIEFAGHVEKVEDLLTQSRVFLLTSKSEGLSIALAEAMMAGAVPVVANVGDLSELVIDGQTGWLVEPGDFEAYATRICGLLNDESARLKMAENGRRSVLQNNSVDAIASRWKKCLDATVDANNFKLTGSSKVTLGEDLKERTQHVKLPL
ncbi:MAG TPA: glycosyltransferase [Verrucomicrobiae bacterium]|nr:glycosyltransferase [Verrucomicrobiae bacterium]